MKTCKKKNCEIPERYLYTKQNEITSVLEETFQLELSSIKFTKIEIVQVIKNTNPEKATGYDLITGKIRNVILLFIT